ncbi:MAG: helix-turn-helix domain-containing protein [Mycobacteriales bacterium]
MDDRPDGFPIVAQASEVALSPGTGPSFRRVGSRMVLGCSSGHGTVAVNGVPLPLRPTDLYVLPWGHSVRYDADADDPFFVHGLHLVPWHRAGAPVAFHIAHDPQDPLAGSPDRADQPLGVDASRGPGGVASGTVTARPGLADLVRYAISLGQHGFTDVGTVRALGELARTELDRPLVPPHLDESSWPAEVRRLASWIDRNLDRALTRADLERVSGRGTSTLHDLVARYLGAAPMEYVAQRRMERARQLLSATHLPVTTVGRRCGYLDPYYFSRVFKRHTGDSPRAFRARRRTP